EPVVLERHLVGRASTAVKVLSSAARNGAANAAKGKRLTDDHRNSPARDVGARLYLDDYWLNQWGGSGLSDMHLPSVKDFNAMRGMKPTWYFSPLTLKAGATGRIRVSTSPGFHLTMIVCSTSQASLADN